MQKIEVEVYWPGDRFQTSYEVRLPVVPRKGERLFVKGALYRVNEVTYLVEDDGDYSIALQVTESG